MRMASSAASHKYLSPSHNAKSSAVLILLYPLGQEWHTLLIRRATRSNDMHSGQISLPGGRQEKGESLAQCALRETYEEVGIAPEQVSLVGELTSLYVFASNYVIHPFIGVMHDEPSFALSADEVRDVYQVPMSHWSDDIIERGDFIVRGFTIKDMPYYNLSGQRLWGATAMIFSEFLHLWKSE